MIIVIIVIQNIRIDLWPLAEKRTKKCLEILPLRGGGGGRLMANAILDFHFDFLHPSLINLYYNDKENRPCLYLPNYACPDSISCAAHGSTAKGGWEFYCPVGKKGKVKANWSLFPVMHQIWPKIVILGMRRKLLHLGPYDKLDRFDRCG